MWLGGHKMNNLGVHGAIYCQHWFPHGQPQLVIAVLKRGGNRNIACRDEI